MQQCLIFNGSLKFSRATYGALLLIAVLLHSQWLVLAVAILIILGTFSLKLNLPYQFHSLVLQRKSKPTFTEIGELNFVAMTTGILLFIGFGFLYFQKFVDFAWIYLLVIDLLIFLACFVGFCVATLMYVFLKKIFKK